MACRAVLWPAAQPIYKAVFLTAMSPLAVFWAVPVPGMTVLGLVVVGGAEWCARSQGLTQWIPPAVEARGLAARARRRIRQETEPARNGMKYQGQ